jgi:predicted phosphodiesterase
VKYAVISDIHGNMPAFRAVLDDAKKAEVNKFIFVGDYYFLSYPNEVIDTIRHIDNAYVVRGNHEDYLDNLSKQDQRTWTDGQMSALYWGYKTLNNENLEYLSKLPKEIIINQNETPIHIFHSAETYINNPTLSKLSSSNYALCYRNIQITFEEYKQNLIKQLHRDDFLHKNLKFLADGIYIFGHTHIQWHTNICNKILINPGSCGIPLDGDITIIYNN